MEHLSALFDDALVVTDDNEVVEEAEEEGEDGEAEGITFICNMKNSIFQTVLILIS